MPIILKLDEGGELHLDVSPDELERAFHAALSNDQALRIKTGDGKVLAINPRRVLYWTAESAATEQTTEHETAGAM